MKFNWGIGIAIAYCVFAAGIILFVVKASSQHYDLVSTDYYNQAVSYQSKIDAINNTSAGHAAITVDYLDASHTIRVEMPSRKEGISGSVSFYKPDNAAYDFSFDFMLDQNESKLVDRKLAPGLWKVSTRWKINGKDYFEEEKLFVNKP